MYMDMIDERDNYYFRLGIQRNATSEEIRRAYYKLARHFHPDKTIKGGNSSQLKEKFRLIHEAYSSLIDKNSRSAYDQKLAETGPPCWSESDDDDKDDEDAFDPETMDNILNQWDINLNDKKISNDDRDIRRIINLSRRQNPTTNFHLTKSANNRISNKLLYNPLENKPRLRPNEESGIDGDHAFSGDKTRERSDYLKGLPTFQKYHRPRNHPSIMKRASSGLSRFADSKQFKCPDISNELQCEKCGKPFAEIVSHQRVCNSLSSHSESNISEQSLLPEPDDQFTNYNNERKPVDDYHKIKRQSKATGQYMSPDSAPCPFCRVRINKSYFGNHISSCMLTKHAIRRPTSAVGGLSRTEVAKQYAKTIPRPRSKVHCDYER